jgi:hypothetical protein
LNDYHEKKVNCAGRGRCFMCMAPHTSGTSSFYSFQRSTHPVLEGEGRFAFEEEGGMADLVSSAELRRFLAGSAVQCVFVSGCQSGKAPREALAGVCQSLVGAEVPLAVGWAASIADDLATNSARTFYRTLVCEMHKA